ncbi:MAG: c-type cytochrome [Xanthomonadales bacterium]
MLKKIVILAVLVALAAWLATRPRTIDPSDVPDLAADPVHGEWVFHAGGCASCHGADLSGGHEMTTPFGVFHVPNITPHPQAGIGGWTLAEFANAMLRGVGPDGRHYYPAFPYTAYTRMTWQDLIDLKAWLDTFEPSAHRVARHELPFPWNVRRGIGLWKRLYLNTDWVLAEATTAEVQRGRYLVEALGHCGECHTPRDRFGGLDTAAWLAGAPEPAGEGRAPDITPHAAALGGWSARDIAYYLETGFTPEFDTVGGSMVDVQENLARLTDADRAAIAAYLKAVPPVAP